MYRVTELVNDSFVLAIKFRNRFEESILNFFIIYFCYLRKTLTQTHTLVKPNHFVNEIISLKIFPPKY